MRKPSEILQKLEMTGSKRTVYSTVPYVQYQYTNKNLNMNLLHDQNPLWN